MNAKIQRQLARRKRRIERRLDKADLRGCSRPMFTATNIHYEVADRARGIVCGGIGAMHLLVKDLGDDVKDVKGSKDVKGRESLSEDDVKGSGVFIWVAHSANGKDSRPLYTSPTPLHFPYTSLSLLDSWEIRW